MAVHPEVDAVAGGVARGDRGIVDSDGVGNHLQHRTVPAAQQLVSDAEVQRQQMSARAHGRKSFGQIVAIERDEVARLLAVEIDDGDVLTGVGFESAAEASLDHQFGVT